MASDPNQVDEERAEDLSKILQTYREQEILAALQYCGPGGAAAAVLRLAAIGEAWLSQEQPLAGVQQMADTLDSLGFILTARYVRETSGQSVEPSPASETIKALGNEQIAALALRQLPGVAAVVRALQFARPGLLRDLIEHEGHRQGRYRLLSLAGSLPEREAALNLLATQGYRVEYLIRGASTALLERRVLPSPAAPAPGVAGDVR